MLLIIDGTPREFVPIKQFRAAHDLPASFGVGHFQPKDWNGLGALDRAGASLMTLRANVMEAVPAHIVPARLLTVVSVLSAVFHRELTAINPTVGLQVVEVEFASAGFNDVCQAYAYALTRSRLNGAELSFSSAAVTTVSFDQVYADWLNASVKIASPVYPYPHADQTWGVQVIAHAYGRIGLMVADAEGVTYVADTTLACPAEGFMVALLTDVCASINIRTDPS